ncbi:MAG: cytochrome ubiquinol oxidase subunit I [Deltaproteobacteria bacterium]|nr:cytochrome ubiquinol oxidase subunit I [Deltaproteobacteria bacterium]
MEAFDPAAVGWARAQFALTAMYHWMFVPLTLGLSCLLAFFETFYFRTGNPEWKRITRFWMRLFAVNFAIGIATGLILEFQFGTNWSHYSWMVGDIFGAPLAIEVLFAFFLEATFFAVMFFGWERVSPRFHLFSTWMVAIGSSLSALWILVANAWMQHPVGMTFNPDLARFEMQDIGALITSPAAVTHFLHATSSSFVLSALFVLSVCSWYLLKGRHPRLAVRSILVASVFGLLSSLLVILSGDQAAYDAARFQPMKLAAMEGLYQGEQPAGLVVFGLLNPDKQPGDDRPTFRHPLHLPFLLSLLANHRLDSFVPGIDDLLYGNPEQGIEGVAEKMARGREALAFLSRYRQARQHGDAEAAALNLEAFRQIEDRLGFAYLNHPEEAVPHVPTLFYGFHVMVALGFLFPLIFLLYLALAYRGRLSRHRWLLRFGLLLVPLGFAASQLGWVVTEMGRQPWAIQNILPVHVAQSSLAATTVQSTFFIFLALLTLLFIAELRIMLNQIRIGPEEEKR